jgi:MFS transporter, DHA2 family, metal-tetracycline-proton antiporter
MGRARAIAIRTTTTTVATEPPAQPREGSASMAEGTEPVSIRLFLAVVASAVFVSVLTGSMVTVLLPLMREEFNASTAQIGWVVTGFALTYAVGVPLYGRISDVFGVRRVFTFGLLGFAVGGVLCALAPNLPMLVLGRVVQATGGAAVPALASVAAARVLPPGQRGGALGLIASSVGIGAAVGPIVGGTIGDLLGWRTLFVGSLLLMLGLLPIARRVLPAGGATGERRFDLPGGVLLGLAAGLFLFGITQGQVSGFAAFPSWGSFIGSAVAAAGFVWRINTARHPFVSPALFANRAYVAAIVVGFCAMLVNLTTLVFVPLLLVEVNDLSPRNAGFVLTPGAVALALLSPLTGRLSDRVGVRPPIVTGLLIMGGAVLVLSTAAGASPWWIAAGIVGMGIGFAFVQSPTSNAAANALSGGDVGVGMGIFAGAFFLGSGTGPALIGALLAARQEAGADAFNPFWSRDILAAPFSDAYLATVVALLLALAATIGLRHTRPDAQNDQGPNR